MPACTGSNGLAARYSNKRPCVLHVSIGADEYFQNLSGPGHVTPARSQDSKGTRYACFLSFVAAIVGFLFGYDLVIISGVQLFLRQQFALTPVQFGSATSS